MSFHIALVGRPNVGKSSLYNLLRLKDKTRKAGGDTDTSPGSAPSHKANAIVADFEGVTRDLIYGEIKAGKITLIDSPGQMADDDPLHHRMREMALRSYAKANLLLLVCDGKSGITGADKEIAAQLHKTGLDCLVLVNKMDLKAASTSDFYELGYPVLGVSAKHGIGIKALLEEMSAKAKATAGESGQTQAQTDATLTGEGESQAKLGTIALLGCPNSGKSTLTNIILKEERQLVHELPGSTRDSVMHRAEINGESWQLFDTAGIRRKSYIKEDLEKQMVGSATKAMLVADIVLYLIDAEQGIRHQDMSLLQLAARKGKGLVIAVNKADLLDPKGKKELTETLEWKLSPIDYAPLFFISAKKNSGLKAVFGSLNSVRSSMACSVANAKLNLYLQEFVMRHPPPIRQGKRSNLRYVTQTATNPPHLTIHGKRTNFLSDSYKKYLANSFGEKMKLVGTPLQISYKNDANPYRREKPQKRQRYSAS